MAHTITFATNVHLPQGETVYPTTPSGYPISAGALSAIVDTAGTPNTDTFAIAIDTTADGGTTWVTRCTATFDGGSFANKSGQQVSTHSVGCPVPAGGIRVRVTTNQASTVSVSGSLS
jgi:hypothetical protein